MDKPCNFGCCMRFLLRTDCTGCIAQGFHSVGPHNSQSRRCSQRWSSLSCNLRWSQLECTCSSPPVRAAPATVIASNSGGEPCHQYRSLGYWSIFDVTRGRMRRGGVGGWRGWRGTHPQRNVEAGKELVGPRSGCGPKLSKSGVSRAQRTFKNDRDKSGIFYFFEHF